MRGYSFVHSSLRKESKIGPRRILPIIATIGALIVLASFAQATFLASGAYSVKNTTAAPSATSSSCSVTSNGQDEKYIYTYAVNANNHLQAYTITGASVFRNVVGGANKVYLFVYVNPASALSVSMSGVTKSCATMLGTQTDNIYWDAQDGTAGRNFATVGGDLVTDAASGEMLFDQFVNVNANPGQASVNMAPSTSSSCSVTSDGQNRNSVYMLFIDDSNKQHAFIISGTSLAQMSVGGVESTSFYVYLSSTEVGAGTSPGSGSCTMTLSHAMASFEWAVRAPPSGNYGIYGTLGAACPPPSAGTAAGLIDQYVDAGYQF